ncbi:hypothetical protein PYCCODRAFT_1465420 [Trametes coccinea BRFM310]|uniref:Protein kinase domain-containing protein n=1 Tax=Trametes coccinea (strain BRFM310) TaxID=1353009 RepID=A0A1Y2IWA5_TRAC3|nr:hypothetical protein PYCCODRAFT_1465420 [Trametes coccinea BRFM310]
MPHGVAHQRMCATISRELLEESTVTLSNDKLIRPDGKVCVTTYIDDVWPVICLTEVKAEIGVGGCDPIDQAKQDYRAVYCSEKVYKRFRDVSCCPCLLLAIAGPNIMVGGAVYAEHVIATPFTDYISLALRDVPGPRSSYDAAIRRAARLIRALKQAVATLNDYWHSLTTNINSEPSSDKISAHYVGPHLTQVSDNGIDISLVYTGRLCANIPAQSMFTARTRISSTAPQSPNAPSDPEQEPRETDVVVKFTKTYSPEGHRLLADRADGPFAPKLFFAGWVKSVDMYVVVMEHIRDAEPADEPLSAEHAAGVRTAVELLHAEGLVFGDLRAPNVLLRVSGGGPLLVDFDWCGPEGEVCYPLGVNMDGSIPWHPEVGTGKPIKKDHDLHLLNVLTAR